MDRIERVLKLRLLPRRVGHVFDIAEIKCFEIVVLGPDIEDYLQ